MASGKADPWIGSHFIGYIVGFLLEGGFTASPPTRRPDARHPGKAGSFPVFRDKKHRLEIIAHKKGGTGATGVSSSGNMAGKVNESLRATWR